MRVYRVKAHSSLVFLVAHFAVWDRSGRVDQLNERGSPRPSRFLSSSSFLFCGFKFSQLGAGVLERTLVGVETGRENRNHIIPRSSNFNRADKASWIRFGRVVAAAVVLERGEGRRERDGTIRL